MKSVIAIVIALSSVASFAASVNDSWEVLNANTGLKIEWPGARMNHGPMTGVDFLCLDGDVLRTKAPVEKCTKWQVTGGHNSQMICVESVTEFGIVNRAELAERCVRMNKEGVCVKTETYTHVQPTSFPAVNVFAVRGDHANFLFAKPYSVEACK